MDTVTLPKELPPESEINGMTELFKVLGDPTRLKMLFLFSSQESYVGEIASKLHVTESAVSHHLQILRLNGLVKKRRTGKTIFYCLTDQSANNIMTLALEHVAAFK